MRCFLEYTNKLDRFFGYLDFEIPLELLNYKNEVVVNIPEQGGIVSTVALINHYDRYYEEDVIATLANSEVLVNGTVHNFEAYEIDGSTYFEIEDISNALNGSAKQFDIKWDEDKESYNLIPNSPLTKILQEPEKSGGHLRYADATDNQIYVDGVNTYMTGYEIQNSDYYKIRDICNAVDVNVSWDEQTNTISLN